jgi:hypothetical protein
MSVWSRLFGRSKSSQPNSLPRLGVESLEVREVPAVVFVGGWGASSYQYAHNDPAAAAGQGPSSLGIEVHLVRHVVVA